MPSKNFSAVQRLTQSLRVYQRQYSGRTLIEKSYDAFGLHTRLSHKRAWPKREESFAAVQLLRQNRNWNNFRKFGGDHSHNISMTKRAATPRRNNILAAKSASSKRVRLPNEEAPEYQKKTEVDEVEQQEPIAKGETTMKHPSKDDENEKDVKLQTVRDIVFGSQDNSEDEREKQRMADADLLNRVSKQKHHFPDSSLSKKVIAPYLTYKTHRNSWAEFRHRMIYGGSSC